MKYLTGQAFRSKQDRRLVPEKQMSLQRGHSVPSVRGHKAGAQVLQGLEASEAAQNGQQRAGCLQMGVRGLWGQVVPQDTQRLKPRVGGTRRSGSVCGPQGGQGLGSECGPRPRMHGEACPWAPRHHTFGDKNCQFYFSLSFTKQSKFVFLRATLK